MMTLPILHLPTSPLAPTVPSVPPLLAIFTTFFVTHASASFSDEDLQEIHSFINAGLESKALTPHAGKNFALADAGQAHIYIMDPKTRARGKVWLSCE